MGLHSQQKAVLAAQAASAKQAEALVIMDLRTLSTVTDYFVVCTAQSRPQMAAIKEQIERVFKASGCAVWHTEDSLSLSVNGDDPHQPQWVLMDCGDVVLHILNPQARTLYRLEDLWADAPRLAVPPDSALLIR